MRLKLVWMCEVCGEKDYKKPVPRYKTGKEPSLECKKCKKKTLVLIEEYN